MNRSRIALAAGAVIAANGLLACGGSGDSAGPPAAEPPDDPDVPGPTLAAPVEYNDVPVHDPSVVADGDGAFYVIGSHLAMARSTDLVSWTPVADGVDDANPLFDTYASEIAEGIAWTGGHVGSWAPDIVRLADGRWYFYYSHCATADDGLCDAPRSYLGVAVADDIEGPYTDLGIFLYSSQTDAEIAAGYGIGDITSFDGNVHPNVIDPDVFYDADGRLWMTYGSYSGGIFILEMDDTTGMPLPGQGYGKHLTGGFFSAIEGSAVLFSPESGYYYLFTSFGGFAADDGYNVRVARSRTPDGPYFDAAGNDMALAAGGWDLIEPFGVKLVGGFELAADAGDAAAARGYLSPGHNSAWYDEAGGEHLLVMHTRFPGRGEQHAVRVHEMFVNADGWLVASPHRYAPISGDKTVAAGDLPGDYKFIDHERDINREPKQTAYITLTEDGRIEGELTGELTLSADGDVTIDLDGRGSYRGVARWQWDQTIGELAPSFTALSADGASIWGTRMASLSTEAVIEDVSAAIEPPARFKDGELDLPARGTRGAEIDWQSDNPAVIAPDGRVVRPAVGEGDRTVGLTATISLDGESTTVSWFVTVPARLPLNRVARWDFEDDLADSLGRFEAARPTGDRIWKIDEGLPAFASGHEGRALELDGGTGIRLPDGLIDSYEYSVSLWVNPDAVTPFTTAFFGAVDEQQEDGDPFSERWISFVPESWDGNTMLWSGSEAWLDGSTGVRIPASAWSHLAFSVERGFVRVYLNGEETFASGHLRDFFSDSAGRFALGVNYWDPPFDGRVDELKIYDAALSAGEIAALDIEYLPPSGLLARAVELLDFGDLSGVAADIHLPRSGPFAAALAWTSSDPTVIAVEGHTGVVTRPGAGQPAAEAVLTASLTLDGGTATKDFTVTVLPP